MNLFERISVKHCHLSHLSNRMRHFATMQKVNCSSCPLLCDKIAYDPDTLNLITDPDARQYWLNRCEDLALRFVEKASTLHPNDATAKTRAEEHFNQYVKILNRYRNQFSAVDSPLSVRTLLDINEAGLKKHGFEDAWKLQKDIETKRGLELLSERLNEIDAIASYEKRWEALCAGVIAGNMFDWGAKDISKLLELSNFSLNDALCKIEKRPWMIDTLDEFVKRMVAKPYKSVAIFLDNAGMDFVLGIVPFAREFLRKGAKVYLCANSKPALNDITFNELMPVLNDISKVCPIIANGLESGDLCGCETGQKGPCLDLSSINDDLCETLKQVDLIILEGMGRALHTNLYAKFKVDCMKIALVKSVWLAERLGGKQFSVVCKYEPHS